MTAPLKHTDPVTVDVALGDRAYDIVIGRDVLPSLGKHIAALRPGARTAVVTDRNVAKHWLAKTEASLAEAGIATSHAIVEEGEGSKSYAVLERAGARRSFLKYSKVVANPSFSAILGCHPSSLAARPGDITERRCSPGRAAA
jgi:hypothetical protein